MKVLVLGASGQVGRALAEIAPDFDYLGRKEVDLSEPGAAMRAITAWRPSLVVNAAAYTAVDRAESEPDLAYAVNATAVGEIADAADRVGAAVLHFSTDYVFDGLADRPWRVDDIPGPLGVYGASKLAGEQLLAARLERSVILRTSWVYAPWGRNFVMTMLALAGRDRLQIVDDQRGAPTSALDLAAFVSMVARRLVAAGAGAPEWGLFHLCGGGVTSWAGFAQAIFAEAREAGLVGRVPDVEPIRTSDYPTAAKRPLNSALDCSATEWTFGVGTVPWPVALRRVIGRIAAEGRGA